MNSCQIRVLTNGFVVVYMDGAELKEYAFTSRKEMMCFINESLEDAPEADS